MGVKFDRDTDSLFEVLNTRHCKYHPPDELFHLIETKKGGETNISAFSSRPCFHVEHLDDVGFPIIAGTEGTKAESEKQDIQETRRHSDHLVFLYNRKTRRWTLHIFELTATISWKLWDGEGGKYPSDKKTRKIRNQFNGALIRAHAILGMLRQTDFERIYLHCAYRKAENLSALRVPHTKPQRIIPDYLNQPIELPYYSVPLSPPPPAPENVPLKLKTESKSGTDWGVASVILNIDGFQRIY